ncbi:MAG: glycosyltransferase family 4 protein [Candidatus Omnitrophica bacterium]|nr:glycosyltransferase family 4 protein [Candidatus Omnitrophota bacterium]
MYLTLIRHSIRNRGGDRLILDYCRHLLSQGYRIEYWTNEINTYFPFSDGIQIKKIPFPGILGTMMFTLSTRFKSDFVIVDLVLMACLASIRNRGRVIYIAQDYDVTYYRPAVLRQLTEDCYRRALKKWSIPTISVSEGLTQVLSQYEPSHLITVPNGVDLHIFSRNKNSDYRRYKTKPVTVLVFSRDDYRKGLDVAEKAVAELAQMQPQNDWEIWTIGPAKMKVPASVAIKEFGFIKSDEELRDLLSAVDIFLIPSRSEGLSLLLLQALACGCAIVTTSASTIIQDGLNGLVSPIEDPGSLAKNLNRVIDDPQLRENLQHKARELSLRYDQSQSFKKIENFIKIRLFGNLNG